MRLINKTVAGAVLLSSMSLSAIAQQVPNGGFEGEWVTCKPWTSAGEKTQGTQPQGWVVSNVGGVFGTLGATTVAFEEKPGYDNSEKAVKLKNGDALGNKIPAYMTFGTPWSTAQGFGADNKDGGTFGGMNFEYRPDVLKFEYKYEVGAKASVIAYLWKGHWEQPDVPGNIALNGDPKKVIMTDRDKCVLGILTGNFQGGKDVKEVNSPELIASYNKYIEGNTTEWTTYSAELEYHSEAIPEMVNIIISPDDYFGNPSDGNTIIIDNVRFVYYSKLSSLKVGDKEVALEKDKYDYDVDAEMPADENAFSFVALGKSAKTAVALDKANNKATITVSNDGADDDGALSHVYTLAFKAPQEEAGDAKTYPGYLNIEMAGSPIANNEPAVVTITPTSENTCDFLLPNLTLPDLGNLGNIEVKDVKMTTSGDVTTYEGSVDGMKLMLGTMEITANVVVSGTTKENGDVNMLIKVLWVEGNMPIDVTFSSDKPVAIEDICIDNSNAPVEYFNLQGVRVDGENLTPGIYVRRQGNATSKILVK